MGKLILIVAVVLGIIYWKVSLTIVGIGIVFCASFLQGFILALSAG